MSNYPKRHLFLIIWLTLTMISGLGSAIVDFFMTQQMKSFMPTLPNYMIYFMGVMGLCNVIFAIALFYYKKWGFWGYCVIAVIGLMINLFYQLANPILSILAAMASILILYWALNVGKENKAWNYLK